MKALKLLLALLLLPLWLPIFIVRRLLKKRGTIRELLPPDAEGLIIVFPDVGLRFAMGGWKQERARQGHLNWSFPEDGGCLQLSKVSLLSTLEPATTREALRDRALLAAESLKQRLEGPTVGPEPVVSLSVADVGQVRLEGRHGAHDAIVWVHCHETGAVIQTWVGTAGDRASRAAAEVVAASVRSGVAPLAVLMRAAAEELGVVPMAPQPEHAHLRLVTKSLRERVPHAVYEPLSEELGVVFVAKASADADAMQSITEESLKSAGVSRETYKGWALANVPTAFPELKCEGPTLRLKDAAPNAALALLKRGFVEHLHAQLGQTFLIALPSHMAFAVSRDDREGREALGRVVADLEAEGMVDLSAGIYRVGPGGWSSA